MGGHIMLEMGTGVVWVCILYDKMGTGIAWVCILCNKMGTGIAWVCILCNHYPGRRKYLGKPRIGPARPG